MATAQQRREQCPFEHSTPIPPDEWRRGMDEALGVIICADGRPMYKMRCRSCQTVGGPVGRKQLELWGLSPDNIEWTQRNEAHEYDPCVVASCGRTPTEYHHFAPRNTFGADADEWPCLPLCRFHHAEWHRRMDGYRWNAKGVAA